MDDLVVFEDAEALARGVADELVRDLETRLARQETVGLVLAGGATPRSVYACLAERSKASRIDWARVRVYFGDERAVTPDDAQSNYRMAFDALLSRVPIPETQIHRMRGESPFEGADEYERLLRAHAASIVDRSLFDVVLLGLGEDGHTASLFPNHAAVRARDRWVVAEHVVPLDANRITLTPPILNCADRVVFLVSGASKAHALDALLARRGTVSEFPALAIVPEHGPLAFRVDRRARP